MSAHIFSMISYCLHSNQCLGYNVTLILIFVAWVIKFFATFVFSLIFSSLADRLRHREWNENVILFDRFDSLSLILKSVSFNFSIDFVANAQFDFSFLVLVAAFISHNTLIYRLFAKCIDVCHLLHPFMSVHIIKSYSNGKQSWRTCRFDVMRTTNSKKQVLKKKIVTRTK